MVRKHPKRHNIHQFGVGSVITLKVLRERMTLINYRCLFERTLDEPYLPTNNVSNLSGIIKRMKPAQELSVIDEALWLNIVVPDNTKIVELTHIVRTASKS